MRGMPVSDVALRSKGYQQLTALGTAASLTVPEGCRYALIQVEAQGIRYRDDGPNPTGTVGMPLPAGAVLTYSGDLSKLRFIEQTAGAKLNVLYYY